MAIIDTFLKLMVTEKADALRVVPDEAPVLIKADASTRLSMPALSAEMVAGIVSEIVGLDAVPEGGAAEGVYYLEGQARFGYRVVPRATGYGIEMRPFVEKGEADGAPRDAKGNGDEADGFRNEERVAAAVESSLNMQKKDRLAAVKRPSTVLRQDDTSAAVASASPLTPVLRRAVLAGASDLFLSSESVPYMRRDGAIVQVDTEATPEGMIARLLPSPKFEKALAQSGSVDFGASWDLSTEDDPSGRRCRLRINVFRHARGLGAALRLVRNEIPSLRALSLPDNLNELCAFSSGLVLITGPSGSGKSSTLAALIAHINRTASRHIITIEDPIEFEYRNDKALIHQRELGTHVVSFSDGLRAAMRENPDVIMLGEMRDLPTIAAALTAAETGHLVFSTLHTGSAAAAVTRMIDVFPGHQQTHVRVQIASCLRAVVAQRLLPARDAGRVPAIQKLIVTHGVATQIREGREHQVQSAIQTGGEDGMITFERSLAALLRSNKITRAVALGNADDQHALLKLIGG